MYVSTTYNQNNRNTTKIVGNTDKAAENKHTKLQRTQLPTLTQMKIRKTSGSNRDTIGKNQNYPQLPQQQNQNKDTTTSTITTPAEEITVIPETNPIPATQQEEIYDSPSLVTNHRNELIQQTPEPKNIATPETLSENKRNKITPKTKKQLKDEVKTYKAKKFTTQLQQTNFCDIGRLTKAAEQEKNTMIALSMYDGLGLFDPSNEYIMNYKNKDILQKYKEISKDRPTKNNNLIQLYDIIKNIELRG